MVEICHGFYHFVVWLLTVTGERLSMPTGASDYASGENETSVINPALSSITDLDESLHNSCTLPTVDDEPLANDTTGKML